MGEVCLLVELLLDLLNKREKPITERRKKVEC